MKKCGKFILQQQDNKYYYHAFLYINFGNYKDMLVTKLLNFKLKRPIILL